MKEIALKDTYNPGQKSWDRSRQMASQQPLSETKIAGTRLPFHLSMLTKILKKKNTKQCNCNLDNSFKIASFQELFASKNSLLQLE